MPSTFRPSQGTTIALSTDNGTTYTNIAQVDTIGLGNGGKMDLNDITNLGSTGGYREWSAGLRSAGTVTLKGNFTSPPDAGQALLFASFDSNLPVSVKVTFALAGNETVAGTDTFLAWVSDRPTKDASTGKNITFSANLTITGPITSVAGH